LAFLVLAHGKIVVRCHYPVSTKNLPKVEGDASAAYVSCMLLARWWANEW